MGKFLKTVFGGNGIVSNMVDIVEVPKQIQKLKNEIQCLKTNVDTSNKEHDVNDISSLEVEETLISEKEKQLLLIEKSIQQILSSTAKDTSLLVSRSIEFDTLNTEIESLRQAYAIRKMNFETQKTKYEATQQWLINNIQEKESKLRQLEEKLQRKKNQLDGNFEKLK
jgi:hypothetical protein